MAKENKNIVGILTKCYNVVTNYFEKCKIPLCSFCFLRENPSKFQIFTPNLNEQYTNREKFQTIFIFLFNSTQNF